MKNPLTIHSDASESLHYNIDTFPLYTHKDELRNYDYQALVHWHPDLEFIYIVDGIMDYFINGEIVRMHSGNGIFVNSQRLHYGFSKEHYECTFIALVISPDILIHINKLCDDYFKQKFGLKNTNYILLDQNIPWMKEVLSYIPFIHDLMHQNTVNLLEVISKSIELIGLVGAHLENTNENLDDSKDQDIFLKMTDYISKNYSNNLSLEFLSDYVGISRNRCCELFKKYSNETPMNYINLYRIDKSVELLKNTHLSVTEIAEKCGFNSPSYFTSVFTKVKGKTPKTVRINKS